MSTGPRFPTILRLAWRRLGNGLRLAVLLGSGWSEVGLGQAPAPVRVDPPSAKVSAGEGANAILPVVAERALFDAALRDFKAGLFGRAAKSFAEFEAGFPNSELKPDAEERRKFAEAAAEADPATAAGRLATFGAEHSSSPLAVNAILRAALAWLQVGRPESALKLLDPSGDVLSTAIVAGEPKAELFSIWQTRAEAALRLNRNSVAIEALQKSENYVSAVGPEAVYNRLKLLVQASLAAGEVPAALTAGEQLRAVTRSGSLTNRRPEAVSLLGAAWLRAGDRPKALAIYAENLVPSTPIEWLREATLQVAEAALERGDLAAARTPLEAFMVAHPADARLDRIRWLLAQVLFSQYRATRVASTNDPSLLVLGEAHLSAALTNIAPELRGEVQWLRGLFLWEGAGGTNQLAAAVDAFTDAVLALPKSVKQAAARFKLGDVRFKLGQPALALTNYQAVVSGIYDGLPEVDAQYATLAWLQATKSAIAATNAAAANQAMEKLVARDPRAEATATELLQLSQEYVREGLATRGRGLLEQFVARFPDSPLRAELELTIADALRREERWPAALSAFDRWLAAYTNHPRRAWAEFGRAEALSASGAATNAIEQLQLLATRYPNDPQAQTALLKLGDNYLEQREFGQAEQAYTSVLTNALWAGQPAQQEARLLAARAALGWKQYARAEERLIELVNDKAAPADLLAEGFFTLGQVRLQAPPGTNTPLAAINGAREAFTAVVTRFTNSPRVPEAWLMMADCYRQLGATTPGSLVNARELYLRLLDPTLAIDPSLRAHAKMDLGRLALQEAAVAGRSSTEAKVLKEEGLQHFLDVALGKIIATTGPLDANVLAEAADLSGQLLEGLGRNQEAARIYERAGDELPNMRLQWERRRERLRQRPAQ